MQQHLNIHSDTRKDQNEVEVNSDWSICSGDGLSEGSTGGDLLDFFRGSLGLNLQIAANPEPKAIILEKVEKDAGFDLTVSADSILIRGNIRRGAI